jgi:hypothetical protein
MAANQRNFTAIETKDSKNQPLHLQMPQSTLELDPDCEATLELDLISALSRRTVPNF